MFKEIMKRMSKKMWKNQKGFSLMELIVVIAILGVLAGIAVPNVVSSIEKSKRAADRANAAQIARAISLAKADGTTVIDSTKTEFNASNFSTVIPKYLQGAPAVQVKVTGADSTSTSFFVTVIASGGVTVFARSTTGTADTDYEIYPIPSGEWAK